MSDQFIHSKVIQQHTHKQFFLTLVYAHNQAEARQPLWEDLINIAQNMDEAWCVLGDFNSVLGYGDRMGGTEVKDFEIKSFANCTNLHNLQEMRYQGPYYTWLNKMVWTRIDMVFTNVMWYDQFDFSQVLYKPNALSDHNPMVLDFPGCKRPPKLFQFYNMWTQTPEFHSILTSTMPQSNAAPGRKLHKFLERIKPPLIHLNRDTYADL